MYGHIIALLFYCGSPVTPYAFGTRIKDLVLDFWGRFVAPHRNAVVVNNQPCGLSIIGGSGDVTPLPPIMYFLTASAY